MQLRDNPARGNFVLSSIPRWDDLAQQGASPELWEKVTSAFDGKSYFPVDRMHFYAPENQMILLGKYCCGSLIDLKNTHAREIEFRFSYEKTPSTYSAHKWEEYIAWSADDAFAMIEQVADDPQSEFRQTLNYLKTDDEFKANKTFGCSVATLQKVRSLLKAVLTLEIASGDFGESKKWLYWMSKTYGLGRNESFPENLLEWKTRICTALGCRELNMSINKYINTTGGYRIPGPEKVINRWLAPTAIEVSAPTAHEIIEAQLLVREFERDHPL